MRYKICIALSVLLIAALVVTAICFPQSIMVMVVLGIAAVIVIIIGYYSVVKPLAAVRNGFDLLRSQDFGSRLRKTGQADADKVIELFNRMMETMKSERLKLMEQNLFLTKLIDVSPLGIAICDFDDNVIQMNPVYRKLQTPAIESVLLSLKPDESRVVRLASSQIYRCSRLWFMDSGFQRTCYIIEVLTKDIIESERGVFGTIVRTLGHEVNNTLAPVISVLDSLEDMCGGDGDLLRVIAGSRDSCMNLVEFVRGYSGVVKLPVPVVANVDIAEELKRLLPVFQSVTGENVKLRLDVVRKPITLKVDMMLIERALVNIVKNASESIGEREGGEIVISVDGNRIKIMDNGQGISDEVSAKLFTPFFSTKRPDRGLGLMLVADILRSHNAWFSLKTNKQTGLTEFEIKFYGGR